MTQPIGDTTSAKKEGIPEGLWLRCPECGDMLFRKVVEEKPRCLPRMPVSLPRVRAPQD